MDADKFDLDPNKSRRDNYLAYLKSEQWQTRRRAAVARAGYKCQLCGCKDRLDVHHNDYERLGCEFPEDLVALCRPCHEKFHGKLIGDVSFPKQQQPQWSKYRKCADLTPQEIDGIRRLAALGESYRNIGKKFGTNKAVIKQLTRKKKKTKPAQMRHSDWLARQARVRANLKAQQHADAFIPSNMK